MAIEGATGAAETTVVTPVASGSGTPAASGSTGAPNPADNWATERAGFLADLKKERSARQAHETKVAQFQAQLDEANRRVQALAGVAPVSDDERQVNEVKDRFKQVFKDQDLMEILGISKEDLAALKDMRQLSGTMQDVEKRHWTDHTRRIVGALEKRVADEIGQDLKPSQVKALRAAFTAEAETNPEFLARFEAGDEKLVEDFAKAWAADWFEPTRRKQQQQVVENHRPVPFGKDRSIPGAVEKKIDVTNDKAVMDMLVASRKEQGKTFGRSR